MLNRLQLGGEFADDDNKPLFAVGLNHWRGLAPAAIEQRVRREQARLKRDRLVPHEADKQLDSLDRVRAGELLHLTDVKAAGCPPSGVARLAFLPRCGRVLARLEAGVMASTH